MEYTIQTTYDKKTLTAMVKGLRRTLRKKRSRRSHIYGWVVIVLGLLLMAKGISDHGFTSSAVVSLIAVGALLLVLVFEDHLNAWIAGKRLLAGTKQVTAIFDVEKFISRTEVGTTEWKYDAVKGIVRVGDYLIFTFSNNHAQAYDLKRITGGETDVFLTDLSTWSGKTIESIK